MRRLDFRRTLFLSALLFALRFATTAGIAECRAAELPEYAQWQTDVKRAIATAVPWLEDRARRGGAKLAIVLDIDNTALQSQYHPGQPNQPVLELAKWASQHRIAVLFATGRGEKERDFTLGQLRAAGYPIDALCMRGPDDTGPAAVKQRCRQEFTKAGYTITANIGNRPTDLEGSNYEEGFKLPDYGGSLSLRTGKRSPGCPIGAEGYISGIRYSYSASHDI